MTYPKTWFRLAEVTPLALHALSCAGARRGDTAPGEHLRWSSIDGVDRLTCPGQPDDTHDGGGDRYDVPAATALMWRPERQRQLHPAADPARTLPLTTGPIPLIHALRKARTAALHWVALSPDGEHGAVAQISAHRPQIVPHRTTWSTAEVVARSVGSDLYPYLPRAYPALVADGWRDHTGGLLARFTRATAAEIVRDVRAHLADLPAADAARLGLIGLDWHGDAILINRIAGATIGQIDRCYPDGDSYYSLGAYLWGWQHLSDSPWPHVPAGRRP
ncbi:hypothetical protein AB0B31_11145 [Catellatospora citrea]|uniref:hypothetical protein n=1 Tax=Catellatospora citrea TaxID=53366 RepID=UPI0033F50E8C